MEAICNEVAYPESRSLLLLRVENAKRSAAHLLRRCAINGDVIREAADIYSEIDRIEWMIKNISANQQKPPNSKKA